MCTPNDFIKLSRIHTFEIVFLQVSFGISQVLMFILQNFMFYPKYKYGIYCTI